MACGNSLIHVAMQSSVNLHSLSVCSTSFVQRSDNSLFRKASQLRWSPTSRCNPPDLLSSQITSPASAFGINDRAIRMHHTAPRRPVHDTCRGSVVRSYRPPHERIAANPPPLSGHSHTQPHFRCPAPSTISRRTSLRGGSVRVHALGGPDIALVPSVVAQVIDDLGLAALIFLATTVVVVPTCKQLKLSPILGFLGAGVLLNRLGLVQNVDEFSAVSQLGIIFLLFQMGLELSLDRLKDLARFSFGLGLSQILLCTAVFSFICLPPDLPISPSNLVSHLPDVPSLLPPSVAALLPSLPPLPSLPSTTLFAPLSNLTLDEDIIIALALSLSSSAFVLNLLDERKELGTTHGAATLGVLLMQDIAVVPLLAILPVLEGGFEAAAGAASSASAKSSFFSMASPSLADAAAYLPPAAAEATAAAAASDPSSVLSSLASTSSITLAHLAAAFPSPTLPHAFTDSLAQLLGGPGNLAVAWQLLQGALTALAGLGAILVGGQFVMKPTFAAVQKAEAPEAFLAICLLAVGGTALITERLGLSDSLGAFLAGAILSTTPLKADVLLYTTPYQKLFLGLFFVTTGSSIDFPLLLTEWPSILAMLVGLLSLKTAIISLLGPRAGLSLPDSIRTAFLLSQGGEFAFVVLALANELGVLPMEVNRLLIAVVVLSMALTPALNEVGSQLAGAVERLGWGPSPEAVVALEAPCMSDFLRDEDMGEGESGDEAERSGQARAGVEERDDLGISALDPPSENKQELVGQSRGEEGGSSSGLRANAVLPFLGGVFESITRADSGEESSGVPGGDGSDGGRASRVRGLNGSTGSQEGRLTRKKEADLPANGFAGVNLIDGQSPQESSSSLRPAEPLAVPVGTLIRDGQMPSEVRALSPIPPASATSDEGADAAISSYTKGKRSAHDQGGYPVHVGGND